MRKANGTNRPPVRSPWNPALSSPFDDGLSRHPAASQGDARPENHPLWVNQGTNAMPTLGQPAPYTRFFYNNNGAVSQRDRRYTQGGLRQVYDFLWDGDDRLRRVDEAGTKRFSANYNGDGIRVKKEDTRGPLGLQVHNYSYGPTGLLHETNPTTIYTPGFGHRSNAIDRFYHPDWLGGTRYTSDSTGNAFPAAMRFDAFGNRSATEGTDPPPKAARPQKKRQTP